MRRFGQGGSERNAAADGYRAVISDPARPDAAPHGPGREANPGHYVVPPGWIRWDALLVSAFAVLQIAVAVLLGNVMTRVLFRGWERVKTEKTDWLTTLFYLGPLGMIFLVLIGSSN